MAELRIEGVVVAGPQALRSPLLGRECVYWDVRRGLRDEVERSDAAPFWVETEDGRWLVPPGTFDVDVRAKRSEEILDAVATDTQAISDQLRELKETTRHAAGDEARRLRRRREQLSQVVTFLYVVRAHANGKLHLAGKSLKEQGRWIEANAPKDREDGATSIAVAVDRYEVVIADGDRVIVEGVEGEAPIPPGMGAGGGYRERPTCRALRGGAGPLRITGVGALRPPPRGPRDRPSQPAPEQAQAEGGPVGFGEIRSAPAFERVVVGTLAVLGAIAVTLWLLLE